MEETSVIDTFGLCWKAILAESKLFNCILNEKSDIIDSRDSNFSFDIIGLLCALYNHKNSYEYLPELKAVNLYDSWLNMYNVIVQGAYDEIYLKSCIKCNEVQTIPYALPPENIQLIQNDIYNKLSPDAEKFISDSNVLLMVNVFVSSKPTADGSFINTLKKIFSLLRPGTLIFFVGTKCIKKLLEDSSLSDIVKCIFGHKKVTLQDLALKETLLNTFEQKPLNSGSAHFIVWQKKEMTLPVIDKTAIPEPTIDTFNLCWNAILTESKQFNDTLFTQSHCNLKDSRDSNFIKVETRLAYTFKFGYLNTQYIEKCISNFLLEFPHSETIFPLENLQICSLSNGPGLDIIGLLCALYKSKKHLLCFPQLKAVNLHDSWLNMYKMLVQRSCEALYLKSHCEYFQIRSENIHFIQSDIYSTISPEAEKFISESNVLLMVNTFLSSKATGDTCSNTLKKIFSLLKPGTLICFIGTKQNKKKNSEDDSLKNFVKCIFGPKKITIESLSPNEAVVNTLNVKLETSGSVYFNVWQKREREISLNITEKQEALKNVEKQNDSTLNELSNSPDAGSETSFTSFSKESELSDELKNGTNSLLSDSDISAAFSERELENLSQNSIVHSVNNITSIVDKMESVLNNVEDSSTQEFNFKCTQPNLSESESNNLEDSFQEIKLEEIMTNKIKSKAQKEICSLNKVTKKRKRNAKKSKITQYGVPPAVKEYISSDKANLNLSNIETSFTNGIYGNAFSSVIQNEVCKVGENISNGNKEHVAQECSSSVNQSHENTFKLAGNATDSQILNDRNSLDTRRLIRRCDSLITSLEEMTADIKRNMNPRSNDQHFKCCGVSEACRKFRIPHSFANTVLSNCCRKVCKCNTMKNTCMNSLSCKKYTSAAHECCFENRKSMNFSRPYIVIPLQTDDM